jgi:hypothetical protein
MKFYNKVLKTKFNTNIDENHIGYQYQPAINEKQPITKNSEAIRLNAMSDVEGLDRAYARDNGIYIFVIILCLLAGLRIFRKTTGMI